MPQPRPAGFTLVELLVVIAIVTVLLSLLTPAMDQAIYQAELAVCASQLKTIATGSLVYASENARAFPYRYWRAAGDGRPYAMNFPGLGDDRPAFEPLFSLKVLVDPMVEEVRIDAGSGSGSDHYVYITRAVWAGWSYPGFKGMLRIGDHLEWSDPRDARDAQKVNRFDVLAADLDMMKTTLAEVHAAHPDVEGRLSMWTVHPGTLQTPLHVFSEWFTADGGPRGPIDALNYAYQDGSVGRLRDVQASHGTNAPGDERLRALDILHNTANNSDYRLFLPPR